MLRRAGFEPVALCLGHLDAPGRRRLAKHAPGLLLGKPDLGSPEIVRTLASTEPDVLFSWFWPRRIPPGVLALPKLGAFGVHPSLLPRWRGPDPYFWAVRAGDTETGVTLHRLEAEYDTGEILAQRRLVVRPEENAWQLARRLDRPSLALLVEHARRLAAGETLRGTPQDGSLATSAPRPDEATLTVDWHLSAEELARLVRAAAPAPGASALFEDSLVTLEDARVSSATPPGGLEIGEAWSHDDAVHVRCGVGALEIRAVRVEDGSGMENGTLLRGPDVLDLL